MFFQTLLAALVIASCIHAREARADDCDPILDQALLTRTEIKDFEASEQAGKNSYCMKSFQQMEKDEREKRNLQYKEFSYGENKTERQFNQWKSSNCGSAESEESRSMYRLRAQQALGEGVANNWLRCKERDVSLSCYLSPKSKNLNTVTFHWNYNPPSKRDARIVSSLIEGGRNTTVPRLQNEILPANSTLKWGHDSVVVTRDNANSPVKFQIRAVFDGTRSLSCDETVAVERANLPPPKIDLQQAPVGSWCAPSDLNMGVIVIEIIGSKAVLKFGPNPQTARPTAFVQVPADFKILDDNKFEIVDHVTILPQARAMAQPGTSWFTKTARVFEMKEPSTLSLVSTIEIAENGQTRESHFSNAARNLKRCN